MVLIPPSEIKPDTADLVGGPFEYREEDGTGFLVNTNTGTEVVFFVVEDTDGLEQQLRDDPDKRRLFQPWPCHPDTCGSRVETNGDALLVHVHCLNGDLDERRVVVLEGGARGTIYTTGTSPEMAVANAEVALRSVRTSLTHWIGVQR